MSWGIMWCTGLWITGQVIQGHFERYHRYESVDIIKTADRKGSPDQTLVGIPWNSIESTV